jgi:hypothetical protein
LVETIRKKGKNKMDLIKKVANYLWILLEDFGRAKAAAALARNGNYDLARSVISEKSV